jgi:hypothetical protein
LRHLTKKTLLLRRLSGPALTCVAQIFMLETGTRGMQGFFLRFLFLFVLIYNSFWAHNSRPYWQAVGEDPTSSPIAESRQEFRLHGTAFEPRSF